MNFSLSNETVLTEASILVVLMVVLICFVVHIWVTSKLARNIDVAGSQASLVPRFEKLLWDANDELRKGLGELDQGLRSAVSTGMKDSLVTSFEQVKAGMLVQTNELARSAAPLRKMSARSKQRSAHYPKK